MNVLEACAGKAVDLSGLGFATRSSKQSALAMIST